jgi:hypothetical protein
MITCPNCGKDNELGRIFCLKCGAKLDLNAVGPPRSAKKPGLRKARKAAKAMIINVFIRIVKVSALAFTASVITLVFLPPSVTRYKTVIQDGDSFDDKKFQLEDAINSATHATIVFSEKEINGMLLRHTKAVNEDFKSGVRVGSIYASIHDDLITFSIDRKWKYFHIFLVYTTRPAVENGKFNFEPVSGAIGRFPIPNLILEPYANLLSPLWTRFKFDKQTLDQVTGVKLQTNHVTLTFQKSDQPAGKTPAPAEPGTPDASATDAP